jgi:hypothetical protein
MRISGIWHFFSDLKILLLSTLTGHVKCKIFHICSYGDLCKCAEAVKVAALLMACKCTYLRIFAKLKIRQNTEDLRVLTIFFRFSKFHFIGTVA